MSGIIAKQLFENSLKLGGDEQTPQRLYSRMVNYYLAQNIEVPINADELYRWHREQIKQMVDDKN